MNFLDLRWLWRALRGRSVTFALVFLLAMVGLSAPRAIRNLLEVLSLPWLIAWIAPLILLGLLAKLEPRLIRSEKIRGRIALGLVAAGLVFVFVIPRLLPREQRPPAVETEETQPQGPRRLRPPGSR
jgi:hypothetical protein